MKIKENDITSNHIKSALLSYFRFNRQSIVATEVNLGAYGICDVLADSGKATYDIEVKISLPDVRRDFEKYKHRVLNLHYWNIPNYFYFCVPKYMIKDTLCELDDKIGLLAYDMERSRFNRPEKFIYIVRKGQKLNNLYDSKLSKRIVMRLNSEICSVYKKRYSIMQNA